MPSISSSRRTAFRVTNYIWNACYWQQNPKGRNPRQKRTGYKTWRVNGNGNTTGCRKPGRKCQMTLPRGRRGNAPCNGYQPTATAERRLRPASPTRIVTGYASSTSQANTPLPIPLSNPFQRCKICYLLTTRQITSWLPLTRSFFVTPANLMES